MCGLGRFVACDRWRAPLTDPLQSDMLHQQLSLPGYEMQLGQFGRREIIKLVGGAVVAWPGAAIAQAPGRLWKIGVLANESWPPLEGLRHGLRDLGYGIRDVRDCHWTKATFGGCLGRRNSTASLPRAAALGGTHR
jgi:hypothetical protein